MHNLKVERFFKEVMINGRKASADGPIKTFPLRGIKDSPPYLHDDRLLTLEDTVEFFNLVLGRSLSAAGKEGPGGVPARPVGSRSSGTHAGEVRSGTRASAAPSESGSVKWKTEAAAGTDSPPRCVHRAR